jgi:hypothetical protein
MSTHAGRRSLASKHEGRRKPYYAASSMVFPHVQNEMSLSLAVFVFGMHESCLSQSHLDRRSSVCGDVNGLSLSSQAE